MELKHTKPCKDCPFRKESLPGWLGADTPEGFMATTMADHAMPCHLTVDYTDPDWMEQVEGPDVAYCAGALIFFRNVCKRSRDRDRPQLERSPDVFGRPEDFIAHHLRQDP